MTEHKSKPEAVGFIGLGIMGLPMVRNLLKEGIEVLAYDLNQASLDAAIADGAKVATSAQVVAQERGIIITMLPDTPDVEAVLFGQGGVAEGLSAGKLIIDMSSISPE
ncbi:MAG: NAD(P)-binding domain-containing protein, partial [Pseudomonadota bacterium]|nr:NAD(P)-binding domain-containing protein [Pseudomonadota bacterium]